ncbi:MAG TPA: tetratricopeptide repeat protein [Micropepsaceae bacterium]|nr:tetratricopeptide repeat protein [Micropepsaceae bacterium]
MRQLVLSLVLTLPLASGAWGQTPPSPHDLPGAPDTAEPHNGVPDQVPDLQLLPPRGPDAGGRQAAPAPQAAAPQRPVPKPPETEDQLLTRLAKAADKRGARAVERELKARWAHSGSPTADLLLKRADQAMEAMDFDTARQLTQKLTDIAPNFAEAWHRRATLAAHKEDYDDAITSLRHTLALQPKNFDALAELGEILDEYNDKPHALDAFRQARALDPFIDGVDDRIRELAKAVEGQGI